jgi:anaerobic selenocysteine-containing dehydrogenase
MPPGTKANHGDKVVKSTCRMCHGVCGVLVHIKNGRVVEVTGDPDCPTNMGYICPKGRASVEFLYHPDRLKYPQKRIGERGENKWQRISWDEALDTIAEKLLKFKRESGVESVATIIGTGRPQLPMYMRFSNCFGTPNHLSIINNCYFPRIVAARMTSGKFPVCDYYGFGGETPKLILNWGCNIVGSGAADGMCGYQVTRTVKNGAKLIVIDPRKTGLAARADHWLQIRPGTDDALVLGMLHVIINEKLYDKEFVDKWTVGFDEFSERVNEYPPEKVAEITWIPAEDIRAAARLYATTKPACIQWGNGLDQNINTFQTVRAIHCLSAITGNLDVPGGDVPWIPPKGVRSYGIHGDQNLPLRERITPELKAKMLGGGRYKILDTAVIHPRHLLDAIMSGKPYPIRALFVMGSNTLLNQTDPIRTAQAFRKVEFTAVTELFMTPTAQLADILLPASSWLENDEVADVHMGWVALVRQKVAQIGECRDDKQILFDLARRLGLGDDFPWKDVRDFCDWTLEGSGITFEEFKKISVLTGEMWYKKYEQDGFDTPSGKVELKCSTLESMGYDPLPYYVEPPESPYSTPDLFKEYPLIITLGGRILGYFCSEGRQIKSLRKLNPDPIMEIHPDTAGKLGIQDGDWVWIESQRGRIKQRSKLTDGINPGVVHAQHGWWFPEKEPPEYGFMESNVNLLAADMPCDPHTGSESLRSFLCKVYKV